MKKLLSMILAASLAASLVFAQDQGNQSLADPDPNNVGSDSAATARSFA